MNRKPPHSTFAVSGDTHEGTPANRLRTPSRRRSAGFTLIELFVVLAIIAILIPLLDCAVAAGDAAGRIVENAHSEALRRIGRAVEGCVEEAEATLQPMYEDFSTAQILRELPPPETMRRYRRELRDNRGWVLTNLRDLREIYPGLDHHDKRLARALRRPLHKLAVELEREARLVSALLVGHPPDPI